MTAIKKGKVYLIGAGPGDRGLMTCKAKDILSRVDVVIYDYLANREFINGLSCEKIYVGKKGGSHTLPQEEINRLIVEKTLAGHNVARLKGGDPYIFGRGGEEAEELVKSGIEFEIVPGVSSFYAAAAYAGIPLTHRDYADSFEVITGHKKSGSLKDINFPEFRENKTFVFLMGVKNIDYISSSLIDQFNFPADIPSAAVMWGTWPSQKSVDAPLKDIGSAIGRAGISAPAIIIIGNVVKLRHRLNWFEGAKPLSGKKVVVTRSRKQASKISEKLYQLGAEVIEFPVIEIAPLDNQSELDSALDSIKDYSWIIFTSQNAVEIFFEQLFKTGRDVRLLSGIKVAVIGSATEKRLKDYGIMADLLPERYVAESLVESFLQMDLSREKVLIPCSVRARYLLKDELEKMGAVVQRVHTYDVIEPAVDDHSKEDIQRADIITFASSSTVDHFFHLVKDLADVNLASIGPITSRAIENHGRVVHMSAQEYTIDGLVDSIVQWCSGQSK